MRTMRGSTSRICSRSGRIIVAGFTWMIVLLASTHHSEEPSDSRGMPASLPRSLVPPIRSRWQSPTWLVQLCQTRAKIFISGQTTPWTLTSQYGTENQKVANCAHFCNQQPGLVDYPNSPYAPQPRSLLHTWRGKRCARTVYYENPVSTR